MKNKYVLEEGKPLILFYISPIQQILRAVNHFLNIFTICIIPGLLWI